MSNLISVKVIFADEKYNYKTSMNGECSDESIREYFVNKKLNLSVYRDEGYKENFQECIDVEIYRKGLLIYIYENYLGNCSNNGISSRCKSVILVGDGIAGVFGSSEETPPVKVVRRQLFGGEYLHVEPVNNPTKNRWMAGGAFVYCSDSRFIEISKYPLSLHDRQEH